MTKYNAKNERIKRRYFIHLKDADGKSDTTIDGIRKSLLRYEEHTGFKEFGALHREQIIAFKKKLCSQRNRRTGKPIKATARKLPIRLKRKNKPYWICSVMT